ncbi:MAG: acyltransferase, partial [Aquabacterium sp.]|uniref:acyltransferase family protein n=1 Tax=Aquabacterium sp. TaxID=1872578 RepID=UPI0011FA1C5E
MRIDDRDAQNNFTLLRLVLALLVLLGHFKAFVAVWSPPWPFNYAAAAVDCFFVVSGYLVSKSFDRDSNFSRFYLRRFFRIYPLYIAVVLAQTVILGCLAPGGFVANLRSEFDYLMVNAVFANFIQHDIGEGVLRGLTDPSLNASLWTLKIEFAFYLILPFLWLGVQRYGWKLLVGVFMASALYYALVLHYVDFRHAKQLPGQLQFFVLGIAAYRYRDRLSLSPQIGFVLMVVLGVALTLLLHSRPPVLYPL